MQASVTFNVVSHRTHLPTMKLGNATSSDSPLETLTQHLMAVRAVAVDDGGSGNEPNRAEARRLSAPTYVGISTRNQVGIERAYTLEQLPPIEDVGSLEVRAKRVLYSVAVR